MRAPPHQPDRPPGHSASRRTPRPPASRVCLPVAHTSQRRPHWCGPATARMLLEARLGPDAPGQEQLAWIAENEGGTWRGDLQQVLNDHLDTAGYQVREGAGRLGPDLRDGIDHGFALALNIRFTLSGPHLAPYTGGPIAHWIAAVGYDDTTGDVLVLDPAAGNPGFEDIPRTPFPLPLGQLAPFTPRYLAPARSAPDLPAAPLPTTGGGPAGPRRLLPHRDDQPGQLSAKSTSVQLTAVRTVSSEAVDSFPLPADRGSWSSDLHHPRPLVGRRRRDPRMPRPTTGHRPRRRLWRITTTVLALAMAALATAAGAFDLTLSPASAASSTGQPISRTEVLARAESWMNQGLQYTYNGGTAPDPDGKAYRRDCSGYVSMAWHLDRSRVVSTDPGNALVDPAVSHKIAKDELAPGDALVAWDTHVRLFDHWIDAAHTRYVAYDFGSTPVRHQEYSWNGAYDFQNLLAYRYNNITDDGTVPPTSPAAVAPQPVKFWVDTFQTGPGRAGPSRDTAQTGVLNAGTNYVWCKKQGSTVTDATGATNHYWLFTDLDSGAAQGWVSAYYLSRWGDNEARDNNGTQIPDCP
ncbi:C39 family peptidase [Streptomyces sp. AP-93]|uniref:C39 family peptidase n=1 Tax=Streptomyces sp. AP-93 TaxID=2929048 RepID=UPI0024360289|nr:C39 family peptidase [Streptomyces sp. AP-93]